MEFKKTKLAEEFKNLEKWVNSGQVSKETKIVTRGHVIERPFTCSKVDNPDGTMRVTIKGKNDEVTICCNSIIASKYRGSQIALLTFTSDDRLYRKRFLARLTASKQKFLELCPPGGKVTSGALHSIEKKATNSGSDKDWKNTQTHARRRWKELKYDLGFNVGCDTSAQTYSRGKSAAPIHDPFPRPSDSALRKDFLPQFAEQAYKPVDCVDFECNYCGVPVRFKAEDHAERGDDEDITLEAEDGINFSDPKYGIAEEFAQSFNSSQDKEEPEEFRKGLLDHRRPVFQGGGDTLGNLQIFCDVCNNQKATACKKCPYEHRCDGCCWAFPEKIREQRLVLILPPGAHGRLRAKFGEKFEEPLIKQIAKLSE